MMKRAGLTIIVVLMALCLLWMQMAVAAEPAAKKSEPAARMAIKTLGGKGVDADTAATLTDVLCTRLMTHKKYNVICASDVNAILASAQQTALLGSCDDDACYEAIGKLLESPYLVNGTIGKVGKTFVISLSLISTVSKKIEKRVTHEVSGEDKLIKGVRDAADLLMK